MKVKDLIVKLSAMNPDYDVLVHCDEQDGKLDQLRSFTREQILQLDEAQIGAWNAETEEELDKYEDILDKIDYPYTQSDCTAIFCVEKDKNCQGIVLLKSDF